MPLKQLWYRGIACINLTYIANEFTQNNRSVAGGIRCEDKSIEWRRDNLVYDLQGKSLSQEIADLYTPQFHLTDEELKINF